MKNLSVIFICALFLPAVLSASALDKRIKAAEEVIRNRQTSTGPIPQWVVDKSQCTATLRVVKAGLIWGGQGSTGLVSCRTTSNHWSEPSFFQVSGVNFGLQIGIQFLESVLVFISPDARQALNHASFQLGAELSFAAGPVGTGSPVLPNASVLSYQYASGLYAGATVDGFILSHVKAWNRQVYGDNVYPADILTTDGESAPTPVASFVNTLNHYLPSH